GGSKIFTALRPAGANTTKLYMRDGLAGTDKLLIDPDATATSGAHNELDWWQASSDGSHVVFGISSGGSEESTLRIIETDSGTLLPESITRTNWANPSWLPDGSGFFYNRLQDVPPQSLAYEEKSLCWLHRLNTDPATDVKLFGQGLDPAVSVRDIDAPNIYATPGSLTAIGALQSGVQNELTLYASPLAALLAGSPAWRKICAPEDNVTAFALLGEDLYLLTHAHAPHFRVVKTPAQKPDLAKAQEAVPQSEAVIRAIAAGRDGLYILDLNAGLSGVRHLDANGHVTRLALPFSGAIDQEVFYADALHDGAWFPLESWVRPAVICQAVPGKVTQTDIAPPPPIDVSPYTSEEVFVTARDGTRVPLSIVHRKEQKHGAAPLLVEAYGAYGIALDPYFLARWLPFLDRGGVFAVAHVRGGGELGEDWHRAGQKETKYHTWQDTEDCVQHLIEAGYGMHRTACVIGGSAGGITVGRLLTERPDLVAVVVSMVGVSDAMRSEFSPNGPPNIPEFGSVKTEEGFHALLAMDAVQHVHDGVKYPSVLLTTGLHDPRVSPWEPAKMTARLQAATTSGNPVLLRVEADAGHGIGSTRAQRDEETADIMAFILWRTGDPRYQPPS
ncbi:MAG TPA: prolyl oligopeptidase family serine peptidase, partial [Acidocella sp.]|nr:prolyl oligopeptidase family serine peptidase [Acidocella sp.]